MSQELDTLRYPIGRPNLRDELLPDDRAEIIDTIAALPKRLSAAVTDLSDDQLDTPYRPDGWTVRQVVHHVPDSHLNAYVRFKWTATEPNPTIKAYDEAAWAELSDGKEGPITPSLELLTALHRRWVAWMREMPETTWDRTFQHPESGDWTLHRLVQLYAWHGEHHLAHITGLRDRMGW